MKVKICGVTNVADAEACVAAGADAVGLNFVPSSKRCISLAEARLITAAIRPSILVVGVVADLGEDEMRRLLGDAGLDALQLHGEEPPELVRSLLPRAYKAVRVGSAADVAYADTFPGEDLLLDARSSRGIGGTGESFDWTLATGIAKRRRITLAGGLDPDNVAAAIRVVSPYRVDVASGVEERGNPRKKDLSRITAFVAAARGL